MTLIAREAGGYRHPVVCSWPQGCDTAPLVGWPYCDTHHAQVVAVGEQLKANPNKWRNK